MTLLYITDTGLLPPWSADTADLSKSSIPSMKMVEGIQDAEPACNQLISRLDEHRITRRVLSVTTIPTAAFHDS